MQLQRLIEQNNGWINFETFMAFALYAPGMGYYNNTNRVFGSTPKDGSDFITAPELSPLFGQALSQQIHQALKATQTHDVWEFGAGSGALAAQVLNTLGDEIHHYTIVDLSGVLRERQIATVKTQAPEFADRLHFVDALPKALNGIVIGNEVLDAMPVALLHFDGQNWHERGIGLNDKHLAWVDKPTELRPPVDHEFTPGTTLEIHRQAQAFIKTLSQSLKKGAAFFIDYGFPEREYYHPQRQEGTLMCHHRHQADINPLIDVGQKDITAHIDFTGIALAAQNAGMTVLGYTSQARFLINCGIAHLLEKANVQTRANAQKLLTEHEMGELFKVIGFAPGEGFDAIGFCDGDRTHTL